MASTGQSQQRRLTEKAVHDKYLKEFRVNQCKLFPLHKCPNHRPYTCFNWHFPNQRRRSSVKKRDGSFNFSADIYCPKHDESTGICPDGDDCPFLHHTAGDVERRYHIRYFKTSMCVNGTDSRGHCTQNGIHCGFAHGEGDKRRPVLETIVSQQTNPLDPESGNKLDKDRMRAHDPKWQDLYVLRHYKTEECNREPRTCGQGFACPQYHNVRDRRRAPHVYKYRTTPCPDVRTEDDWGEPTACKLRDKCDCCHTRTEQQFHPDIYKSIKCNDMLANNYCPRGHFCAFSHDENEQKSIIRAMKGRTLVEVLSSPATPKQKQRPPPPPVYIPPISESINFFKPCVPSYAAVASTPDANKIKMDELLKESSVEDSPVNKVEESSLPPVAEVEVEQAVSVGGEKEVEQAVSVGGEKEVEQAVSVGGEKEVEQDVSVGGENEVEHDEQPESVPSPTPIISTDSTDDFEPKPDSSDHDDLEKFDNADSEGRSSSVSESESVSVCEQSVHNDMTDEEAEVKPTPLPLPPLMDPYLINEALTFLMFSQREDLTYLSLEKLREYQQAVTMCLDAVNKGLNGDGHSTETPP